MQNLKDSELRYRRLFEAAQDGILILDAKTGMIEDVNPYLIKMLGYSREEFVKKKLWEVGAFRDIEASKDAFEALQDNEYIRYEDLPLKAKDGRLIQVEFVSNVYLVGDEKVIQCNIRDNAEHKRIIAALQANEKKYHDLINQSPDGYFIIELSGNILTVNKAMCKELEFSEEEFLSMTIWDIIPEPFLDQYRERLTKILKGESLKEAAEYEVRGKDGKNHYVEVLSAPRYSGKDIIGFQGIARDVTARKQTEEALRESERRFQMAIWATKDVVWELNFPANTILWNDSLQKLFHYQAKEIKPTVDWWQNHIHPAERTKVMDSIQTALEQGEDFWSKEYRFRLADGSYADIFNRGYILYDGQGKPLKLIGAMVDVTEQKQADEALRLSEEKYRMLVAHLPTVVYTNAVGDASSTLYISPQIETLLGYTQQECLADPKFWSKTLHPEDREYVLEKAARTGRNNEPFEMEYRMIARDGRLVWVHDQAVLVSDLQGNPRYWQGIMLDITERKEAERALYESEDRFRNAFQYSAIGMALVSLEGNWLKVNPQLCSIIGYSEDELLAKKFQDNTHPDDLDDDLNYLNLLLAGEIKSYMMEKRYFHKEGRIIWALLAVALATDRAGTPLYFISQIKDITERKQSEMETRHRLSELEVLYQSGLAFSQLITPRAVAEKIITLLDHKMDWHHTAIHLYHPETQTLELLAFHLPNLNGQEEHSATEERFKIMQRFDQGLSGWVARHGQTVRSDDLKNDLRYFETFPGLQSGLYVPIKIAERVIGVISIGSEQPHAFSELDERLTFTLAGQAAIAIENATLFDDLQRSNSELMLAYETTLEGWSHALDLRDKETEGHTQRVTELAVKLARVFGLSEAELVNVRRGGLLHDIGKMGVPDHILLKPGKLTDEEWKQMRMHPIYAYDLLSHIAYLHDALDIPYYHHEKWDGTGYPHGLKGEQIPLVARIFAVADVWDALNSDRPYRPAWTREDVREHIRASSGTHFDPQVVSVFMQMPD